MLSQFIDGKCTHCESSDIAQILHWWGLAPVPKGINGFLGCRNCMYWEILITIYEATHIFDRDNFTVLTAGKGELNPNSMPDIIYDDPNKNDYEIFDWSKTT